MTNEIAAGQARRVPYNFQHQVSDEFVRLPEPTASDGWRHALATLMPEAAEEDLAAASAKLRDQLRRLDGGEETTIQSAMCIGTEAVDGDERLSMGLLGIAVRPSTHENRLFAAEGIYRAKEKAFFGGRGEAHDVDFERGKGMQGHQDMVLAVKLPCGPAVMSTSLRSFQLPAAEGGTATPPLPIAVLQLIVPAPHGYCVYATISTPSVFLLDSYSARLAHIGRSLTFDKS